MGTFRLKLIEIIEVMIKLNSSLIETTLISQSLIENVLGLFFKFDLNNILHFIVRRLIFNIIENEKQMIKYFKIIF